MEILDNRLKQINDDIIRAENNKRIADLKLKELLDKKKEIEKIINSSVTLPIKEINIAKAIDILKSSSSLKDLNLIKSEILKATNILNTKEEIIMNEVKV